MSPDNPSNTPATKPKIETPTAPQVRNPPEEKPSMTENQNPKDPKPIPPPVVPNNVTTQGQNNPKPPPPPNPIFTDNSPAPYSSITYGRNEIDGAQLVLIPAGKFKMGASPSDNLAKAEEKPLHDVYLDDYYIYRREVTNMQFRKFVNATRYFTTAERKGDPQYWKKAAKAGQAPVTFISYEDASAYCKWAGGRLPTEAEWEKSARGMEDVRIYPWGDKWEPTFFNSALLPFEIWDRKRPGGVLYPCVTNGGEFSESNSPYEVCDLIGNAWEWCYDWFDFDYYKYSPEKNPMGPATGKYRVLKGGGIEANPIHFRISERKYAAPDEYKSDYGFRCVLDVETVEKMKRGEFVK